MHSAYFGPVGNGALLLPALTAWPRQNARQFYTVFGGPYIDRPKTMRGVVVAEELANLPNDFAFKIKDFKTPLHLSARGAVDIFVKMILKGDPVYFGCMAGRGRTGLILSLLAKTFGIKNPVEFVRKNYYSHAVETPAQYQFVQDFEPSPWTLRRIRRARFKNLFNPAKNLTRHMV